MTVIEATIVEPDIDADKLNLLGLPAPKMVEFMQSMGEKPFRARQLLKWIHGRGVGVQRERVRSTLSKHPLVESFSDATADRGGWGATFGRSGLRSVVMPPL